ncbi:MAG: hypothetical protein CMH83_06430 [Nocardioides sp.]|nr:hypothetical protein [Nocardioides sp.]
MISLTRLSGSVFALNADLIERVDATPDTVITLVDGKKYVVAESPDDVVMTIRRYRAETIALSSCIPLGDLGSFFGGSPAPAEAPTGAAAEAAAGAAGRPALSVIAGQRSRERAERADRVDDTERGHVR